MSVGQGCWRTRDATTCMGVVDWTECSEHDPDEVARDSIMCALERVTAKNERPTAP